MWSKSAVLVLALLAGNAAAAELTTGKQTQELCASAANKFATGDIDGAFELLATQWPLPREEILNLGYQSKSQLGMVSTRFGKALGAEFVRTDTVGTSLVRHVFLIKHENHALRMACVFYKPKAAWMVNSVVWDDKPQNLFD